MIRKLIKRGTGNSLQKNIDALLAEQELIHVSRVTCHKMRSLDGDIERLEKLMKEKKEKS